MYLLVENKNGVKTIFPMDKVIIELVGKQLHIYFMGHNEDTPDYIFNTATTSIKCVNDGILAFNWLNK